MDRIEQLESENRQLRAAYELLEKRHVGLEYRGSDEEPVYIASKNKKHFHRSGCKWAEYILNSPNLIEFGSHREAVEAGYKPCKTCRA